MGICTETTEPSKLGGGGGGEGRWAFALKLQNRQNLWGGGGGEGRWAFALKWALAWDIMASILRLSCTKVSMGLPIQNIGQYLQSYHLVQECIRMGG